MDIDYKEIIESIEFPIVVIDKSGNEIFSNQHAKELKVLKGKKHYSQIINYPLSLEFIKKGFSVKGIYREIDKSKYLIDVSFLREKNFLVLIIRDITRFIEIEESLKEEGIVATLSKLLAEIFHEMKGPVGGIKGSAQLLKEDPTDIELIDDILSETKRLERIIEEITMLSRPLVLDKKPTYIHKIIEKVVLSFKKQYPEVKFKLKLDPSLPDIPLDKELIMRVLTNIIRNAIEATNKTGSIYIKTGISWDDVFSPKGDKIFIQIKDSGKGVPAELLDKLFLPIASKKKTGMGLGLSISYKIIKHHNGILRYIGNSTFEILLPLKEE